MNIKKYIPAAMMALLAVGFTGCDGSDEPTYEPTPATKGGRVFFQSTSYTENVPDDGVAFTVPVFRPDTVAANELTVQILATAEGNIISTDANPNGIFTVPATVTFPAEATEAEIEIRYDVAAMAPNQPYTINLAIDDADANLYGVATTTVTATHSVWSEWAPFIVGEETEQRNGKGTYTFSGYYTGSDNVLVLSRTNPIDPNEMEFQFQWLIDNDDPSKGYETFLNARTTDGGKTIVVPQQAFAFSSNYNAYVYAETVEQAGSFNPVTGLFKICAEYFIPGVGSYGEATEYCQLNGYVDTNVYEVTLADNGQVQIGGADYSIINFYLNENVKKVDYTVVFGELDEEQIAAVADAIPTEQTLYEISTVTESKSEAMVLARNGKYTLVAVGYKQEPSGEFVPKCSSSLVFTYQSNEADYKTVSSKAAFSESVLDLFGLSDVNTFDAELQENMEFPGYYRLRKPYTNWPLAPYLAGQIDLVDSFSAIYIDATDPDKVVIDPSFTGLDASNAGLGPVWIVSFALTMDPAEVPDELWGKKSGNKITLNALPADSEIGGTLLVGTDGENWSYYDNATIAVDFSGAAASKAAKVSRLRPAKAGKALTVKRSAKFKTLEPAGKRNSRGLSTNSL